MGGKHRTSSATRCSRSGPLSSTSRALRIFIRRWAGVWRRSWAPGLEGEEGGVVAATSLLAGAWPVLDRLTTTSLAAALRVSAWYCSKSRYMAPRPWYLVRCALAGPSRGVGASLCWERGVARESRAGDRMEPAVRDPLRAGVAPPNSILCAVRSARRLKSEREREVCPLSSEELPSAGAPRRPASPARPPSARLAGVPATPRTRIPLRGGNATGSF